MTIPDAKTAGGAPLRRAPRSVWGRTPALLLRLIILWLSTAPGAMAQEVVSPGVAVYRFAEPGQPVIGVDLWGSVRQTGRYFVAPGTSLLDLITLAGGPVLQAESNQTIRTVTVEVSRATSGARSVVFKSELDALTSGEAMPPPLLAGDVATVRVNVEERFTWLDGLTVAASVASLALIILRVADISGGI